MMCSWKKVKNQAFEDRTEFSSDVMPKGQGSNCDRQYQTKIFLENRSEVPGFNQTMNKLPIYASFDRTTIDWSDESDNPADSIRKDTEFDLNESETDLQDINMLTKKFEQCGESQLTEGMSLKMFRL
jgi:hypothetical protein